MMRLQKYLALSGVASRRNAEKMIAEGRVSVNGMVVTEMGVQVDELTDKVAVDGALCHLEEEKHYLALASQGDTDARNILIERNLRLVAHIMKKYYAQGSDQEDLISIGTIGLIKGITTFDISKGARLATYAARCVENAILS